MKITFLLLLLLPVSITHTQQVLLKMQVLYDGEKSRTAGKSIVHFSDGQVIQTNSKGELTREFQFQDSAQLVRVDKIMAKKGELKMVNRRNLQYIPIAKALNQELVKAYVLNETEWSQRKLQVQTAVDNFYSNATLGLDRQFEGALQQEWNELVASYHAYKPNIISNLTSTIYAELSDRGRKAFALALESPDKTLEGIELLEETLDETAEKYEDNLLMARLNVLALSPMASYYYFFNTANDWTMVGTAMEAKEAAIVFDQSKSLLQVLPELLAHIKDPEFQATNRNDLASIYVDQENYELAIVEAKKALNYYQLLEKENPEKYGLATTMVMFNLGSAYMKSDSPKEALGLYHSVLERTTTDALELNPQLLSIYFFTNKFIANLHQKLDSPKAAYEYYDRMFVILKNNPQVTRSLAKDILFGDYLNYCEGKELNDATDEEILKCYEESIQMLENAFDMEREALGKSLVYHKLAVLLEAQGQNERAIGFYQKSLAELERKETPKTRELSMELLNCIGVLLDDYGRDDEALDHFNRAKKIAQAPGYENESTSLKHLAHSWYKTGQFYYRRHQPDSAHYAFLKTIEVVCRMNPEEELNTALKGNTYNMLGALWGEMKKDDVKAEEYFQQSVDIYKSLADQNPANHLTNFAMAANNLLNVYSRHLETADKKAALALIDSVLIRFARLADQRIVEPTAEMIMYQKNMNSYMILFSGQMNVFQEAMVSVRTLSNTRQAIEGDVGKSSIQIQLISKLEFAFKNAPEEHQERIRQMISQESGNLSWYALFDRHYVLAEVSARRSLELDSSKTWVYTNLAHSLILQGKVESGKDVYNQFKNVNHTDGRMMKIIFLEDIKELEKAGITHPAFAEVKKLLME